MWKLKKKNHIAMFISSLGKGPINRNSLSNMSPWESILNNININTSLIALKETKLNIVAENMGANQRTAKLINDKLIHSFDLHYDLID